MQNLFTQTTQVEISKFPIFTTEYVAKQYGVDSSAITTHKRRHTDELVKNTHFVYELADTNGGKQEILKWTLRGIIKLGMFIRSPQAKAFRLWAEQELEKSINAELEKARLAQERNLTLENKIAKLEKNRCESYCDISKSVMMVESKREQNQKEQVLKSENESLKDELISIQKELINFYKANQKNNEIKTNSKISSEKIAEIRELSKNGLSTYKIAKIVGVSQTTTRKYLKEIL